MWICQWDKDSNNKCHIDRMCCKKWPYYLLVTKLSLILNGFIGCLGVMCFYENIMLIYDTPPNPFHFSCKAIILGTTLHSHLSLWQTETNRIPFNILTEMSSAYQDCKLLSVFYALFMYLFCAVNKLQTGQPGN